MASTTYYKKLLSIAGKKILPAFFLMLTLILINGCSRIAQKDFSEGYINYAIEFEDSVAVSIFDANMRPDRMVIKFKDNNTINKVEGLSGAFSFAFIQNKKDNKAYTLIKLLNKKLFYQEALKSNSYPFAYRKMPEFIITKTTDSIEYLGYNCCVAKATFTDSTKAPFDIYYTNEISISSPNSNTPFHQIEGVMLKFSTVLFDQRMDVWATTIKSSKISSDEFIITPDYEEIGDDVLNELIELIK